MKGKSRRQFLNDCGRYLASVLAFSLFSTSCQPAARNLDELEVIDGKVKLNFAKSAYRPLRKIGHGVMIFIEIGHQPLIVTRVGANEVAAFSATCTHAGYRVLLPVNGELVCSSGHGGRYDLRGNVLHGPPKQALARFNAILRDNVVEIAV